MKNNLVKILGFSALALSLAACPAPQRKVQVISLTDAFSQNDDGSYVYAGQKVKLENLCVYSNFGTTLIGGVPYAEGGQITDLKGIEIELPELPKWSEGAQRQGTYADITVEGVITEVNGRAVLKEASCVVNGEVFFTNGERDEAKSTSKYSCAYWSDKQTVRSNWDSRVKSNPAQTGTLMEGMFQLASLPGQVTTSTESWFSVVFPGENTNGADPENEFVINCRLPKGLSAGAVDFYNEFFGEHEVGDFIIADAMTEYDNTKGGMCFLFENQWAPLYTEEVAEEDRPIILTSWSSIQDRYEGKFKGVSVPDLGTEDAGSFSYTLTDNFSGDLESLVGEEGIENWAIDTEKAGSFYVVGNTGSAHAEEAFEAAKTKAAALSGWVLDEDATDELADDYYYVLKEGEGENEKVIAEINLFLENSGVGVIFAGIRATDAQVSTWAEALQTYCGVVERDIAGFASQIPALPAATVEGVEIDWKGYEDVEGIGMFEFKPAFADGSFADAAAWEAYAESYGAALEEAGFAKDYYLPLLDLEGYYKASTKEFVSIQLLGNAQAVTGMKIYVGAVLNANKASLHLFDMSGEANWTVEGAYSYCLDAATMVFGAPQYVSSSYFATAWNGAYKATVLQYFDAYVIPWVAQANSNNPITQGTSEYYLFYLPSAEEGKAVCIQLEADLEGMSDASPYFVTYLSVGLVNLA